MTTDSGKNKTGEASKSRDGVSPGMPGYQHVIDNTPSAGTEVSGPLTLPASDPTTSNPKKFDIMAPLTFPSGGGSGGGQVTGEIAPTVAPISTSVTPAASDTVTALASQVGQRPPRPAAINNNFTSLASRAGSKRSLIGGA